MLLGTESSFPWSAGSVQKFGETHVKSGGVFMDTIIQVTTTGDSREMMEEIGRAIVERRLASSAQISGPVKSIYWWKGRIEETEEWVCILRSTKAHYEEIQRRIRDLHSYDVPEIISVEIGRALPDYERWVRDETGKS